MDRIYFEDLERLVRETPERETPLGESISIEMIEHYSKDTGDDSPSHTDLEYCLAHGYRDILVPGGLIFGLQNGLYLQNFRYFVHKLREPKMGRILKSLYRGDRIKVIEFFLETKNSPRLIVEGSSPVSVKRKVLNQDGELICFVEADYLIKRRPMLSQVSNVPYSADGTVSIPL